MIAGANSQYAIWVAAIIGTVVALRLLLCDRTREIGPKEGSTDTSSAGTAELAAIGLGPSRIGIITASATLVGAVTTALYVSQQRLGAPGASTSGFGATDYSQVIAEVAAWVLLLVVLVPTLLPRVLRAVVGARYVRRRDAATLLWLRRIRLLVAGGKPTNAAVLEAAEHVVDPAFRPMAGAINLAVATGRDPLAAAAIKLRGSATAALVGTVDAAERSGAAASELIDQVLARALRALDAQHRERIDQLARLGATTASLNAILAGTVVVLMVVTTLPAV